MAKKLEQRITELEIRLKPKTNTMVVVWQDPHDLERFTVDGQAYSRKEVRALLKSKPADVVLWVTYKDMKPLEEKLG